MSKLWWLIPITAFSAISFWAWSAQYSFEVGKMPECNSKAVAALLRQATEDSPRMKAVSGKLFDAIDLADAPGSTIDRRICSATLFTTFGKEPIRFTLEWTTAARDMVWLQSIP